MKQNPCRYCYAAYEKKGRHTHGWSKECHECEYRRKHEKYLESQRKFIVGEKICDMDELLKQEYVFWGIGIKTPKHIEVIKSLQLRTVLNSLANGCFYKAIRKEKNDE